jgi:hypothetical protein
MTEKETRHEKGELLKQIGSERIEGLFAHRYDEFARSPVSMVPSWRAATEVAQRLQSGRILEMGWVTSQ